MRTSEQTDKIDAALAKVQADLDMVKRNKGVEVEGKSTKFATKYATIAALYDACRELLTREKITIWQGGHFEPNGGGERLVTRLAHEGQFIESSFPIKAREGAQNFGGGVAFARRWGLACAVGIFPADDADERHGYESTKAEQRAAKRAPAPSGIAAACEHIREASSVEMIEAVARRIRGQFPTGEAAQAIEKELSAWFVAAVDACESQEQLVALRASCTSVKPKSPDVRTAIANAERRLKGGAS